MKHLKAYHRPAPGVQFKDDAEWRPKRKSKRQRLRELAEKIYFESRYLLRLLRKKGLD